MDQYFWILAVVVNDHPPIFPNPKKKADISFVALVGNDARKVVADGYPLENVVTSDLHQGPFLRFRDYHHMLGTFRGTLITHVCRIRGSRAQALQDDAGDLPDIVCPGDALDPKHLEVVPPFTAVNTLTGPAPDLRSLASLNPLHGRVSAIHTSLLF